jgi:hypothetical protein
VAQSTFDLLREKAIAMQDVAGHPMREKYPNSRRMNGKKHCQHSCKKVN